MLLVGGDSRYSRLAQAQLFKEANPDMELEVKTKKVTDKVSETLNVIANEPSLAFFRIQEHVRKCLPQLVETKHEVQDLQQKIQGASFDAEYGANAVKEMQKSSNHFESIQDLLKNAIFMKQQIDYEKSRREQEKLHPSMYSTKSSPSINPGGDRPGRLSRHHSTSSDRTSHRSREKRVISGHATRPHSSCGVITTGHARQGTGAARSRVEAREKFQGRKQDSHDKEKKQHGHGIYEVSGKNVTTDHNISITGEVVPGGDVSKVGTAKVKSEKLSHLSHTDQTRGAALKGRQVIMAKGKSFDTTSTKEQETFKPRHERKSSASKVESAEKTSSSPREEKPCHSRKETTKESVKRKKGDQSGYPVRQESKATERSSGDKHSKTDTSSTMKKSVARKESVKKEGQHQRQEESKSRHSSTSSVKSTTASNVGSKPGAKKPDDHK